MTTIEELVRKMRQEQTAGRQHMQPRGQHTQRQHTQPHHTRKGKRPATRWTGNAADLLGQLQGNTDTDSTHNHNHNATTPMADAVSSPHARHPQPHDISPSRPHSLASLGRSSPRASLPLQTAHTTTPHATPIHSQIEPKQRPPAPAPAPTVLRSPPLPEDQPDNTVQIGGRFYAGNGSSRRRSPHRGEPYLKGGVVTPPNEQVWEKKDRIVPNIKELVRMSPGAVVVRKPPGEPLGCSFDAKGVLLEVESGGCGAEGGLAAHIGERLAVVNGEVFSEAVFPVIRRCAEVVLDFRIIKQAVPTPPEAVRVPAVHCLAPEDAWALVVRYLAEEMHLLFEQVHSMPQRERMRVIAAALPHAPTMQGAAAAIWAELSLQIATDLRLRI